MRATQKSHRERIAVAVALAATLAGSGAAAAAADGGSRPGWGRIAYTDEVLSLDAVEGADGTAAHVIAIDDTKPGDAPAPGWDTTGIDADTVDQDTVRWSLTGLEGPGELRVHGDGEQEAPLFDSADGLPDGYELPVGQRGFTRWEFTAEGTYQAVFTAEATALDGRHLSVGTVYTILVGDEAIAGASETTRPPQAAPVEVPADDELTPADDSAPDAPQARTLIAPAAGRPASVAVSSRAAAVSTPKVLDEGHIDFAARVVDGTMQIHIKDGTVSGKTTWREPSSVVLHVKPSAKNTLPDSDAFAFLGKAGDPVWLLDQVQQEGLLWPGWSTDNIDAGATKGGVTFSLTKVTGPGAYALYTYDAMSGANVLFNSKDGVPDSTDVPASTHAHGGWAFTKEGTYKLTFTMSGTLADGRAVSDTETVTFVVGDQDPSTVKPDGESGSEPGSGADGGDGSTPGSGSASDGGVPSDGSAKSDGSMASTGAGNTALMGGAAAALAALGATFVVATRRRAAGTARTAGRKPA
ncbi:TIGR03773 family transporter-associated surface protein [Streptomyces sp. NBC_00872]|uniref:TIGR03773 family transporter-associated surface protein n=1 Tax=Streptomyces sp. NBC_00872 TaxID=2903686 RepID=UPI003866D22A|nr:TIGR03773 family transporter-associated surface protein [Streptomyces sp. NBC_00872]